MKNTQVFQKIESISFGVLDPEMIRKVAAVKIVTPELYDKEGYPVDGGLMDIRLGVIDPGLTCKTCGLKLQECLGHLGYIELARPVLHISFIDVIYDLLKSTCCECGRMLASPQRVAAFTKKRQTMTEERGLKDMSRAIKEFMRYCKATPKCPYCNAKQTEVRLEKPSRFFEGEKRLTPIEIRSRLERINKDDAHLFGINYDVARPEWMILTVLPIPPVSMRPSITLQTGERSEDDLTHKLGDIVRINQRLFENINAGAPEIIIEDLWDLLEYHITTYFNNNVAQIPPARHRSGEPLKTLADRIQSKEGRIRYNLAGKRVNFSARTVISPDAMLNINEVGVPEQMSLKLTVPEKVTTWNMDYLKNFVKNGPKKYPGANFVVRPDGRKKTITDETKEELLEEIEPGYVVMRHLLNGDVVLFNRQPSLHRMSMMCHRVRVLPGKTFRINSAVCAPYNADFDGDEMNLHVPQTEEARAEAEILMEVPTQIISPKFGLSVMGCTQDAVTGNFLLTRDLEFPREEAIELLFSVGIDDFKRLPEKERVTGSEIFSMLLPDDFNFQDDYIVIKKGKLVKGVVDARQLAAGKGYLLRSLHKEYGPARTGTILTSLFKLGVKVLLNVGFTARIDDTDLPEETKKQIRSDLEDAYKLSDGLIEQYNKGQIDTMPGRTTRQTFEVKIMDVLDKARNRAGQIIKETVDEQNPVLIMATSGARGKLLNLSLMAAYAGQQSLRGGRIGEGYEGRSLSCFKKDDLAPRARGFIEHGFKHGLSPAEFYFVAMTGRDSLMDTALRTPKSGYLYRRLAYAMQDLKVEYDATVRDVSGAIIQFKYGEDGIDVSKSEHGKVNVKRIVREVMPE